MHRTICKMEVIPAIMVIHYKNRYNRTSQSDIERIQYLESCKELYKIIEYYHFEMGEEQSSAWQRVISNISPLQSLLSHCGLLLFCLPPIPILCFLIDKSHTVPSGLSWGGPFSRKLLAGLYWKPAVSNSGSTRTCPPLPIILSKHVSRGSIATRPPWSPLERCQVHLYLAAALQLLPQWVLSIFFYYSALTVAKDPFAGYGEGYSWIWIKSGVKSGKKIMECLLPLKCLSLKVTIISWTANTYTKALIQHLGKGLHSIHFKFPCFYREICQKKESINLRLFFNLLSALINAEKSTKWTLII